MDSVHNDSNEVRVASPDDTMFRTVDTSMSNQQKIVLYDWTHIFGKACCITALVDKFRTCTRTTIRGRPCRGSLASAAKAAVDPRRRNFPYFCGTRVYRQTWRAPLSAAARRRRDWPSRRSPGSTGAAASVQNCGNCSNSSNCLVMELPQKLCSALCRLCGHDEGSRCCHMCQGHDLLRCFLQSDCRCCAIRYNLPCFERLAWIRTRRTPNQAGLVATSKHTTTKASAALARPGDVTQIAASARER